MDGTLLYDGADLTAWLSGVTVERSVMPDVELSSIDVPGRDGLVLNGTRLRPLAVTITGTVIGDTASEVATARHALAAVLHTRDVRRLVLPDEPDLFYNAVLSGSTTLSRAYERPRASLTFTVPEACAWSMQERSRAYTTPSSAGSMRILTIDVGGNAETWPTIELTTAATWFSVTNNTTRASYHVGSVSSGKRLVVDMGSQVTTLDGAEVWPTMSYDYIALEPGSNSISICNGNGVIRWRERWV